MPASADLIDVELGARNKLTLYSRPIFPASGPNTLHGPHHSAQKSTSTGTSGRTRQHRRFEIFLVNVDGPLIHGLVHHLSDTVELFERLKDLKPIFGDKRLGEIAHFRRADESAYTVASAILVLRPTACAAFFKCAGPPAWPIAITDATEYQLRRLWIERTFFIIHREKILVGRHRNILPICQLFLKEPWIERTRIERVCTLTSSAGGSFESRSSPPRRYAPPWRFFPALPWK